MFCFKRRQVEGLSSIDWNFPPPHNKAQLSRASYVKKKQCFIHTQSTGPESLGFCDEMWQGAGLPAESASQVQQSSEYHRSLLRLFCRMNSGNLCEPKTHITKLECSLLLDEAIASTNVIALVSVVQSLIQLNSSNGSKTGTWKITLLNFKISTKCKPSIKKKTQQHTTDCGVIQWTYYL